MTEVGRELWRLSSPTLAQAASAKAGCPGVSMPTQVSTNRESTASGQSAPMSDHPDSKKSDSLCSGANPPVSLCPLPLVLSQGTVEKNLAASSSCRHIQY